VSINYMPYQLRTDEVADGAVNSAKVADGSLVKGDLAATSIQSGATGVTLGFAVAGEENVSVTITFPTAFASPPAVIASVEGADVGIVSIAVTATGFTITLRDDKGTDYTAGQTATIRWIALEV